MPANNTGGIVHYLAGRHPGRIGLLIAPGLRSWRTPPAYMPYAIDNGAFTGFDEEAFLGLLSKLKGIKEPLWVAVPDCMGDSRRTTELWSKWHNRIEYRKAFVVQDGHKSSDVPKDAYAVFVGGSTNFKLNNAHLFKGCREWLHIGRVSTYGRLMWADSIGADSVDGTGFFRGPERTAELIRYLEETKND